MLGHWYLNYYSGPEELDRVRLDLPEPGNETHVGGVLRLARAEATRIFNALTRYELEGQTFPQGATLSYVEAIER